MFNIRRSPFVLFNKRTDKHPLPDFDGLQSWASFINLPCNNNVKSSIMYTVMRRNDALVRLKGRLHPPTSLTCCFSALLAQESEQEPLHNWLMKAFQQGHTWQAWWRFACCFLKDMEQSGLSHCSVLSSSLLLFLRLTARVLVFFIPSFFVWQPTQHHSWSCYVNYNEAGLTGLKSPGPKK